MMGIRNCFPHKNWVRSTDSLRTSRPTPARPSIKVIAYIVKRYDLRTTKCPSRMLYFTGSLWGCFHCLESAATPTQARFPLGNGRLPSVASPQPHRQREGWGSQVSIMR